MFIKAIKRAYDRVNLDSNIPEALNGDVARPQ